MVASSSEIKIKNDELEWMVLRNEIDAHRPIESGLDKFYRKFKANPLVPIGTSTDLSPNPQIRKLQSDTGNCPRINCLYLKFKFIIGCLATTCALGFGLWSFRRGNRQMSQYMMRARILAQGFTVAALIIGVTTSLATKD